MCFHLILALFTLFITGRQIEDWGVENSALRSPASLRILGPSEGIAALLKCRLLFSVTESNRKITLSLLQDSNFADPTALPYLMEFQTFLCLFHLWFPAAGYASGQKTNQPRPGALLPKPWARLRLLLHFPDSVFWLCGKASNSASPSALKPAEFLCPVLPSPSRRRDPK